MQLPVFPSQLSKKAAFAGLLSLVCSTTCTTFTWAADWTSAESQGKQRLALQDYTGAESFFRQALKDVRHNPAAGQVEVVTCLQNLANVLQLQQQTEESLKLYKQSLHILERKYGRNGSQLIPTLITLGSMSETEGEYLKATKYYGRALVVCKRGSSIDSLQLADCRHHLGHAWFKAGFSDKAEALYRACLNTLMNQPKLPSSALLLEVLADYTQLLSKSEGQGKILASNFQAELLKDNLSTLPRTAAVQPSDWQMSVSSRLANKSNAHVPEDQRLFSPTDSPKPVDLPPITPDHKLTDFAALEQLNQQRVDFYQRMIAVDIKSLGPTHPSVARDLTGLATVYLLQKDYAQAQPLLLKALEIYQTAYGTDSLLVKKTQGFLHLISQTQAPGQTNVTPSIDYLTKLPAIPLASQKLEIALRLNYLAFLCYSQNKLADAERIYAWALASTRLSCGQQNMLMAGCLNDYANVLRSSGKQSEAQPLQDHAQSIMQAELIKQQTASYP